MTRKEVIQNQCEDVVHQSKEKSLEANVAQRTHTKTGTNRPTEGQNKDEDKQSQGTE